MSRAAEALQIHAEVLKLARLLEREPEQVEYLEELTLEDLRALRERVTEVLYDAHAGSNPALQRKLAERVAAQPARRRRELARRARQTGSLKRLGALGQALAGAGSTA